MRLFQTKLEFLIDKKTKFDNSSEAWIFGVIHVSCCKVTHYFSMCVLVPRSSVLSGWPGPWDSFFHNAIETFIKFILVTNILVCRFVFLHLDTLFESICAAKSSGKQHGGENLVFRSWKTPQSVKLNPQNSFVLPMNFHLESKVFFSTWNTCWV